MISRFTLDDVTLSVQLSCNNFGDALCLKQHTLFAYFTLRRGEYQFQFYLLFVALSLSLSLSLFPSLSLYLSLSLKVPHLMQIYGRFRPCLLTLLK